MRLRSSSDLGQNRNKLLRIFVHFFIEETGFQYRRKIKNKYYKIWAVVLCFLFLFLFLGNVSDYVHYN